MENRHSPELETAKLAQDSLSKISEAIEESSVNKLNKGSWSGLKSTHIIVDNKGEVDVVETNNNLNADFGKMSEATTDTMIQSTVSETEASHGKHEISKISSLYGIGNATAEALKISAAENMYVGKSSSDKIFVGQIQTANLFGENYKVGTNRTGNVYNDYRSNIQNVTNYLSNHNIFTNSMTVQQAKNLMKKTGEPDIKFALAEFVRLKEMEPTMKQVARQQGGVIDTGKTWVRESIKDTDFNQGVSVAKTTYQVEKALAWLTKANISNTFAAPVKIAEISSKVNASVNSRHMFKAQVKEIEAPRGSKKWKAEYNQLKGMRKNSLKIEKGQITQKYAETYSSINKVVKSPVKYTSGKLFNGVSKKISKTRVGDAIGNVKNWYTLRIRKYRAYQDIVRKKTAVFRILPNAFSKLSAFGKKMALCIGLVVLILAISCTIIIMILGAFISNGSVPEDEGHASGLQNSQVAIDEVYGKYQMAYETNIAFFEPGSEFSLKGLPNTWVLNDVTDTVNQEPCAIMGTGAESCNNRGIEGYNLTKYWGAKVCEYTASVRDYTGEYDEITGEAIYHNTTITLIGTAGLEGDAGDYSSLYNFIPESTEAYTRRNAKTNELVDIEIGYRGTQYSEYQYKDEYDPTPYSYFIVGGHYDGELLSYGMGMETGHAVDYSENNMYKAFLGMAHGATLNRDENSGFYTDYVKRLYHLITDQIQYDDNLFLVTQFITDPSQRIHFTYTDPDGGGVQYCEASGYNAEVLVLFTYVKTGIQDIMRLEPSKNETNIWLHTGAEHPSTGTYQITNPNYDDYHEWEGWWNNDGTMNLPHTIAVDNYEYKEEDWTNGFDTVIFPESRASLLRDFEIHDILEQLLAYADAEGMSPDQIDFVRFALSCVGKYYYLYGGGHGNLDNIQAGMGLDCSGFVSLVLKNSGLLSGGPLTCSGILNNYPSSSFNGDFSSLNPGSLIVKNSTAGTLSGSSNHVVIYLGYMQLDGDAEPRPYCVECTTSGGVSGVQLSSPGRINTISNYDYVIDLF